MATEAPSGGMTSVARVFRPAPAQALALVFAEASPNGALLAGFYHSVLRDGLDDQHPHLPEELWRRMRLETHPEWSRRHRG